MNTMKTSRSLLLVSLGKLVTGFQPGTASSFLRSTGSTNISSDNLLFRATRRSMASLVSLPEYGTPSYGITKKVSGKDFDSVVEDVTAELKKHGFGVLTKIDMKETMQKKIDVEFTRPYVILGACNPKLANQALQSQPGIGLFLPCNIAVSQDPDDSIVVSVISPKAMFSVVEGSDAAVAKLADDVQETMTNVIDAL